MGHQFVTPLLMEIEEGEEKGQPMRLRTPSSMGLRPSLYIMRGRCFSLGYTLWHNFPVVSLIRFLSLWLGEALLVGFSTTTTPLCCWNFPEDLLLLLPCWTGEKEVIIKQYV